MRPWHWAVLLVVLLIAAVGITDVYTEELERIDPVTVTSCVEVQGGDNTGYSVATTGGTFYAYSPATVGEQRFVNTYRGWLSTRKELTR